MTKLDGQGKMIYKGEMPERLNGTVSKTVVWATVPRVRIPLSPRMIPFQYGIKPLESM